MRAATLIAAVSVLIGAATLTSGCGEDSQATTAPSTPASPTTSTFSSLLTLNGAVSRSFTATQSGTVSVTLTGAGVPGTVVGLGIGVPSTGVARCTLNTAILTTAGSTPQIVASVDAGTYCVAIYDLGTLTDAITFELTIVLP